MSSPPRVGPGTTKYFDHRYPISLSPETVTPPAPRPKKIYPVHTSSGSVSRNYGKKTNKKHSGYGSVVKTEREYRVLKNFPDLASDSLSLSSRRHTRKLRVPHFGSSAASVSTVRSVRSVMSELTKSPFEGEEETGSKGPLTEIRRNMMIKKRHGRKALPPVNGKKKASRSSTTPLQSALEKVKSAAKNYDRYRQGAALTSCFADYQMEAPEFRMQMRRAMGVDLTKKESEAILKDADKDQNGTLDGAEFLLMFFTMAHNEHSDNMKKIQQEKELQRAMEKVKLAEKEQDKVMKDERCMTRNFTQKDSKRVMQRLARHALEFDKMSEAGKRTSAAFCCVLRPHELKEQLLKSFNMKVTKAELGALIAHFDRDGDGDVSGAEFMVQFSRMGMIAKKRERYRNKKEMEKKLESGVVLPIVHPSLGR